MMNSGAAEQRRRSGGSRPGPGVPPQLRRRVDPPCLARVLKPQHERTHGILGVEKKRRADRRRSGCVALERGLPLSHLDCSERREAQMPGETLYGLPQLDGARVTPLLF